MMTVNKSCPGCKRDSKLLPCICIFQCTSPRCKGH